MFPIASISRKILIKFALHGNASRVIKNSQLLLIGVLTRIPNTWDPDSVLMLSTLVQIQDMEGCLNITILALMHMKEDSM